jgi:outer membrane protein assembly factor BamB
MKVSGRMLLLAVGLLLSTGTFGQVVVHEIPSPSANAVGLCWDGDALWVSDYSANLYKVNPTTGTVLRTLTGPVNGSDGLAFANGYLWTISRVASQVQVFRVDTLTGAAMDSMRDPTGGWAGGAVWDGAALWFADQFPVARLLRVSPGSGDTLAMFAAPGAKPWGLAYDGTNLWNSSEENSGNGPDRVYWLDSATGATLWSFTLPAHTPLPAGRRPRGLAWDGQYLWLIAYEPNGWNVKIFQYDVSNGVNPDIDFAETSHNFGVHVVGYPVTWSVNASNIGNIGLTVDSVRFVVGTAYHLDAPPAFPLTISPHATSVFTIRFDPPAAGDFRDTLRVYSNDPDENPFPLFLRGVGLPDEGDIDPQPAAVNFGSVRIMNPLLSSSRNVDIHNLGAGTLHVSNIEIVGDTVFSREAVTLPLTIAYFSYSPVRIWFVPRRTMSYNAVLRIHSDDPDEPVVDVPLSGTGDSVPVPGGGVLWHFPSGGSAVTSVTGIGDVNGDGISDALAAGSNCLVYCLNGSSTGVADTFWTYNTGVNPNHSGHVYYERGMCSSPDLNGDGINDVIVGLAGTSRSAYALSGATGEEIWVFDTHIWGNGGSVNEVSSVSDLNDDSIADVLVAAADDSLGTGPRRVFALSGATGQLIWPGTPTATHYVVRAIHDVTGDNIPDVVGGGTNGMVNAYNGANGASIWSAVVTGGSTVFTLLPMGNANPEVSITEDVVVAAANYGVCCFDGGNGALIWSVPVTSSVHYLAVGTDITFDDVREVYYGTYSGLVCCANGNSGQTVWSVTADPILGQAVQSLTAVPDVTGDGIMDVACGTFGGYTVLLNGCTGARAWFTQGTAANGAVDATGILPDVDYNSSWEILAGHRNGMVEALSGGLLVSNTEAHADVTRDFALGACYPNPFNATTTMTYTLLREGETRLEIFDVLGRRVVTLVDAVQPAGTHSAVWIGENGSGATASSGVYFARLQCGSLCETRKLVLMK